MGPVGTSDTDAAADSWTAVRSFSGNSQIAPKRTTRCTMVKIGPAEKSASERFVLGEVA
jgi:hypothetical protein